MEFSTSSRIKKTWNIPPQQPVQPLAPVQQQQSHTSTKGPVNSQQGQQQPLKKQNQNQQRNGQHENQKNTRAAPTNQQSAPKIHPAPVATTTKSGWENEPIQSGQSGWGDEEVVVPQVVTSNKRQQQQPKVAFEVTVRDVNTGLTLHVLNVSKGQFDKFLAPLVQVD